MTCYVWQVPASQGQDDPGASGGRSRKGSRKVSLNVRERMPYTDAVIHEVRHVTELFAISFVNNSCAMQGKLNSFKN